MSNSVLLGSLALNETLDQREHIRNNIRRVMEQLEEVLTELKEVAKELKEIVAHIDKLTADIDLDSEEDIEDGKTAMPCSTSRSKKTLGNCFIVDHFSDFCSLGSLLHNSHVETSQRQAPDLYRRSCGDLPALYRPVWASYSPKASWLFGSGEKIHSFDNASYHALCCDDDDFDEESGRRRSSRFSSSDSVFSSSPVQPLLAETLTPTSACKYRPNPGLNKKALRSCSTQTVSHKSTQTVMPYSPARKRAASEHKN
ncbi:inhibitory synaptic factor 1 [Trichomycterus rosablanca]|uniref:inhibitory synaptic factor 1 n=1 Tax=Trichomycterus rosablanca TaxID=2290929 RepID=UPI002F360084